MGGSCSERGGGRSCRMLVVSRINTRLDKGVVKGGYESENERGSSLLKREE